VGRLERNDPQRFHLELPPQRRKDGRKGGKGKRGVIQRKYILCDTWIERVRFPKVKGGAVFFNHTRRVAMREEDGNRTGEAG
jgi:hypothetical protein